MRPESYDLKFDGTLSQTSRENFLKYADQDFDALEPEQFHNRPARSTAEQLAWALMAEAYTSLRGKMSNVESYIGRQARLAKVRELAEEARDWMLSDRDEEVTDFLSCCRLTGMRPKLVRARIPYIFLFDLKGVTNVGYNTQD